MDITYKTSGVDIDAGDKTIDRIKPLVRSTFNKNVLTDIGLFGGFYEADFGDIQKPVLVASTDGVGTKLKIAFMTGIHNTVGQCLVNHCVNDILTSGARPLFFLDYFATGKLVPDIAEQVISGFAFACKQNECALIGGETAEMPSFYNDNEYDISGTIIGVVAKDKIINGKNVSQSNLLIGLPSSGLHTNGYSLARNVLLNKYTVDSYIDDLGKTLGDTLLEVHRSYFKILEPILNENLVNGISHITGGGIIGNTKRIIPSGMQLNIHWNSWSIPPIFQLIQKTGNITDEEMRRVFNLGIGLILITDKNKADRVLNLCSQIEPVIIGEIIKN
jgi:phosphoribosylformylglycinamidine cyclo-ligase